MKHTLLSIIAGLSLTLPAYGSRTYEEQSPKSTQIISQTASDLTTMCEKLAEYVDDQEKLLPEERYSLTVTPSIYHITFKDNKDSVELAITTDKETVLNHRRSDSYFESTPYDEDEETPIAVQLQILSPDFMPSGGKKGYMVRICDKGADGVNSTNPVLDSWLNIEEIFAYTDNGEVKVFITPNYTYPINFSAANLSSQENAQYNTIYANTLLGIKNLLEKKLRKLTTSAP